MAIRAIAGTTRIGCLAATVEAVDVTNRVVKLQTGYLYHYAFVMLIGVVLLVSWYLFTQVG